MAARRRKCLQVFDTCTSFFTSWSQPITSSVSRIVQENLARVSSVTNRLAEVTDTAHRLAKQQVTKTTFCEQCTQKIAEMTTVGTSVDPPTEEQINEEYNRDIRERLILQALLNPEINNDKMFPPLIHGPRPETEEVEDTSPAPRASISCDYLKVSYPQITNLYPIPGSGYRHTETEVEIEEEIEREEKERVESEREEIEEESDDLGNDQDDQDEGLDSDLVPVVASDRTDAHVGHATASHNQEAPELVEDDLRALARLYAHPQPSTERPVSCSHTRPTYKFGGFGVVVMNSLPTRHWYLPDPEPSDGAQFYTCHQVVVGYEAVPVPASFTWSWLPSDDLCLHHQDVLGEGTFSTVLYINLVQADPQTLAIQGAVLKTYKAGKTGMNDIIREADMACYMASLGVGPGILGLVTPMTDRGCPLPSLLMDYMPGTLDLYTLFNSQTKPNRCQALDVLIQTARLLTVMHNNGVLHNDVKLNNVVVVPNPLRDPNVITKYVPAPVGASGHLTAYSQYRVFFIDYGESSYQSGAHFIMTQRELEDFYKFPYLPPEVVLEGGATSMDTDVYSFGMLVQQATYLLGDDALTFDLMSVIHQCTGEPSDRPTMAVVERMLMTKMPKLPKLRRRLLPSATLRATLSADDDREEKYTALTGNTQSTSVLLPGY